MAHSPTLRRSLSELPDNPPPPAVPATPAGDDHLGDVHSWLRERLAANTFSVTRVPLRDLERWHFAPDTGNLVHDTGRFFSIEGLRVRTNAGPVPSWSQPIIHQPEIGILGILVRRMHGSLQFLLQAKMEPGNTNVLQLSPTVQATRSNYERAHGGSDTRYLEYFVQPARGRVVVDVLQSEQGARFFRKRNRNMIVEVTGDVPADADFRWLTLPQIRALLHCDNIVNMDSRTVLSCLPPAYELDDRGTPGDSFSARVRDSLSSPAGALHSDREVLGWLAGLRRRYTLDARRIPLDDVTRWTRGDEGIRHDERKYFTVIAASVRAGNREVVSWAQPLLEPSGEGVVAILAQRINGLLHVLVQGTVEAGHADVVELAPTVHCVPGNYHDRCAGDRPRFLDYVLGVDRSRVRYDTLLSEEGGRFYHEQNRHLVIDVEGGCYPDVPDDYLWVTLGQLKDLVGCGNTLSIQARSMLSCLCSMM